MGVLVDVRVLVGVGVLVGVRLGESVGVGVSVGVIVRVHSGPEQSGGREISQSGQPSPSPIASEPVVGKVTSVPLESTNWKK